MQTIDEAKKFLRENFKKGAECPCCGQFVKRYKRKISSSMAYGLILIYKHKKVGEEFHLEMFLKSLSTSPALRGDIPKLRFWGLLKKLTGRKEDGNPNNGYYELTQRGVDFVEEKIKVSGHVLLFNQRILGIEGELIGIKQALKNKFSYEELMK